MKSLGADLRDAVRAARIGFARLDASGRFEDVNFIYTSALGWDAGGLNGKSWRATVHPDDHGRAADAYSAAIQEGQGYVEGRGLRADGTVVHQAMTITRRGEGDAFQGFYCLWHDISSYKSDREVLALAVESSPNGLVLLDAAGRIRMVNAAAEKLFGYSRQELAGCPIETLLPARLQQDNASGSESPSPGEGMAGSAGSDGRGLRKDGVELPLQVCWSTIDTPQGALTLCTMIDIAERVRYQSRLEAAKQSAEAANRAKSDFLARMSHEIRTPMNLINGMNALLLETPLDPKQREYVEIAYRNVRRLLRLINGILDLSKVESGNFTLQAIPFDVREVLKECAGTIGSAIEQKGLRFEVNVDPRVWPYWIGDPERLQQVLLNLIGNAIKFTAAGKVEVTVEPAPGKDGASGLRFEVSDTGCGVAADQAAAIFEPFQQADGSLHRRYEGTGLGLSIARTLVQAMSGDIGMVPHTGVGSKFAFTAFFPRADAESLAGCAGRTRVSRAANNIKASTRILVAEDNPENIVLLQAYLRGLPLVLDFAADGREAVAKRRQTDYDLVLMDIQMPVMDGYEATREIRAWEKAQNRVPVPIVALTAHALTGAAADSLQAGCQAHVSKPIEADDLIEAIARFAGHPTPQPAPAPSIEQLRPRFLANRQKDLTRLREALAARDFATITTIGHDCKGIGKSYGFPSISVAGAALEKAGRTKDPAQVEPALREFEETVMAACADAVGAAT